MEGPETFQYLKSERVHIHCNAGIFLKALARPYALILLNSGSLTAPLVKRYNSYFVFRLLVELILIFISSWSNACLHICADGAANRLYSSFNGTDEIATYIPEYIVGDMDSILPQTRDYYEFV
jgi:hypothetical protein